MSCGSTSGAKTINALTTLASAMVSTDILIVTRGSVSYQQDYDTFVGNLPRAYDISFYAQASIVNSEVLFRTRLVRPLLIPSNFLRSQAELYATASVTSSYHVMYQLSASTTATLTSIQFTPGTQAGTWNAAALTSLAEGTRLWFKAPTCVANAQDLAITIKGTTRVSVGGGVGL